MNRDNLKHILHFAEINGMLDWPFETVVNEYLTTKELAEDYELSEIE